MVHRFRIQFDLGDLNQSVIDEWLRFVVNKNVEILELDLQDGRKVHDIFASYNFPLNLSNATVVELASLKKLYLNNVVLRNGVVEELLTRCPLLESISIHRSIGLTQIRISGQGVNLKHLEIENCLGGMSVHLNDCDLVSFTYKGTLMDLDITNLPKLKEFNIRHVRVGFENYVLSQLSSCVSSLEALSFLVDGTATENLLSIPRLPNVKKLKLTIDMLEDGRILNHLVTSIREACSNLETFIIKVGWYSQFERTAVSNTRSSANIQPFKNLKVFKMLGYYGRTLDYELAAYVIHNAVALEKVVIDPRHQVQTMIYRRKVRRDVLLREEVARSSAKRQLESLVARKFPGAKFVIL
ncbi:hypothetical protein QVD17_16252 [Tagetes erecta]|uniref:At1g61320/AtMIF1 LRR domain-containing protein n=1 Tax=Tagetes erecta TaxID=13708 RepID=A0AAD8P0I6_TARER|nr:hypothetical protein QVD17_16252 [Tagetes erecta]